MRAKAEAMVHEPGVIATDRVYKPTYTIEFNREGEVLLYSGNPIKNSTIYFHYPHIFCNPIVIKMNHLFPWPSSTMYSTLSILSGTGTASSSISPPLYFALEFGTGEILSITLRRFSCFEVAEFSEYNHRLSVT